MKYLITQRESSDKYGTGIDILENCYVQYFEKLNIFLIPISNFFNLELLEYNLNNLDFEGVILTGGGDVPIDMFDTFIGTHHTQPNRDQVEILLIEYALKMNKSILGICRGFQFINGYFGGKTDVLPIEKVNIGNDHDIDIGNVIIKVNHYHNHVVYMNNLSKQLSPLGIDREFNSVEAFYSNKLKIFAMQFHPERTFEDEVSKVYISNIINKFLNSGEIL